jgi:hypothetical protein
LECREWVSACLAQFATELNNAFEYIRWRNQGLPLVALWVVGGGARIAGLLEGLAAELTLPIRVWELPGATQSVTADYAIATALAAQRGHHA